MTSEAHRHFINRRNCIMDYTEMKEDGQVERKGKTG
jgi:hypothetical protein